MHVRGWPCALVRAPSLAAKGEATEAEATEAEATADAKPARPARDDTTVSWSRFFSGKKRETQTEKETKAGGQLNDVVAIPRNAQPGDDEMEDAFMAFGAPTP